MQYKITTYKGSGLLHMAAYENNFEILEDVVSMFKKHDYFDVMHDQRRLQYTRHPHLELTPIL